jgi:hypothetical protein
MMAMTNFRQISSFLAKLNQKALKNANSTSKINFNASIVDSNVSKLILDSKLKPRGEG